MYNSLPSRRFLPPRSFESAASASAPAESGSKSRGLSQEQQHLSPTLESYRKAHRPFNGDMVSLPLLSAFTQTRWKYQNFLVQGGIPTSKEMTTTIDFHVSKMLSV